MKYRNLLIGLACLAAFSACKDEYTFVPEYKVSFDVDEVMTSTVDASKTYQEIDGFGASGAWTMDYVGKYWDDSAKEDMSKLLFSQEVISGVPQGIGLSIWRFNLGGGSYEKGNDSGITNSVRRVECFLNESGSYDWSKSSGQQYFMRQAKDYGCDQFVLFSNTPPVFMTKNGQGRSGAGANANLKDDYYDDFADFLATTAEHFQGQGYNISHISPVNEPEYNWNGTDQEGSGWQNSEIAKLAKELDKSLTAKGLDNTMMLLSEAAHWEYTYNTTSNSRGNAIDSYFNSANTNTYIGNLTHLKKELCAHSYYSGVTWDQMYSYRSQAYEKAKEFGLKLHQTEWSMLEEYEDCPFATANYMDYALAMSRVIHQDLVTANVSSWSYWTAASQEQYSQMSRFYLIRLTPKGGDYGDIKESGEYSASKNLWVLGNYSLFIRPGYTRIDLNIPGASKDFFGSAYISPDKDKVVVVYTNMSDKNIQIENTIEGLTDKQIVSSKQYVTSNTTDLQYLPAMLQGYLAAKSVSTFIYELQ
ncbi:glycoside hydrolase family 30 protein [Bacteroides faecium]|jgi:O-glycosyl hydrolase|uniref:Glycoside hydrolase family 30 protein n=1 Tax=Bacteroides faecium TaxID=2715212 RepID=A0A6H0KIV2_9BACE|nr:glycoside hydrolase family 30 protein [Bacteroides faecium]QIU93356.1 glycoside hydrolase family 30 protein [Bacteroides faecium]